MEDNGEARIRRNKQIGFWKWAMASLVVRLILCAFSKTLNLSSRPEVSTPITSLRRLAEGYWLKKLSMSPYSGSMYHGSPLMLSVLGPLTLERTGVLSGPLLCSLVSVIADLVSALLIRAIGHRLEAAHARNLNLLGLNKILEDLELLPAGDIAALVYLWNPFAIVSCVGYNTSPIENLFIVLSLYGASAGLILLAALGWVIASHLSLYPLVLAIPVIFLLGFGVDKPPRKLFQNNSLQARDQKPTNDFEIKSRPNEDTTYFLWKRVILFLLWASLCASYVFVLCAISIKDYGGLREMFTRTYGFILTIQDLSPNIGVLWYFFAEVFDFFRNFFLMVFHANILFMILPLAIRLNHRPLFLAFVYLAISSMLKSYPSVGDSALCLSLLALFINDLAEMKYSFFLFFGYIGISLLSPVMHNLWIWRGTGNANFYFATAMAYACFQIVLVVESVSAMLNYDRKIRKMCDKLMNSLTTDGLKDGKS